MGIDHNNPYSPNNGNSNSNNAPNNFIDINYSQNLNDISANNLYTSENRRSASENPIDYIKNQSVIFTQKTDRLNNLKEKASDEWAMIVKYNHLKHLEEEQSKKFNNEEKKRKVRDALDNQMKEKDNLRKLKQEEDKKFFALQSQKIKNIETEDKEKQIQKIEKVKAQKEMQDRLIQG